MRGAEHQRVSKRHLKDSVAGIAQTHLSKRSLPDYLDRSEVVQAQLRSAQAQERRLALAELLQLALLTLLGHGRVRGELPLELYPS